MRGTLEAFSGNDAVASNFPQGRRDDFSPEGQGIFRIFRTTPPPETGPAPNASPAPPARASRFLDPAGLFAGSPSAAPAR